MAFPLYFQFQRSKNLERSKTISRLAKVCQYQGMENKEEEKKSIFHKLIKEKKKKEKDFKPFPTWATTPQNNNPSATSHKSLKTFPSWADPNFIESNTKTKSNLPSWAIENKKNYEPKRKKDYTSIQIFEFRKKWLIKHGYDKEPWNISQASEHLVYSLYDQLRYIEANHGKKISPDFHSIPTHFIHDRIKVFGITQVKCTILIFARNSIAR